MLELPAPPGAVAALLRRLVARMEPEPLSATLFGSAASGTADELSDVDLALVLPKGIRAVFFARREPERVWQEAVRQLESRWYRSARPRLDLGTEGEGLTMVRDALRDPGSIWSDAAVNGICVGGSPLPSLAGGSARFDPEAARTRRVRNAMRVAGGTLRVWAIDEDRPGSPGVALSVLWPGVRLAADALAGATTGERVQMNRPVEAAELLARVAGRRIANRYERLVDLYGQTQDGSSMRRVSWRDVDSAIRLGNDLLDRAKDVAGGKERS